MSTTRDDGGAAFPEVSTRTEGENGEYQQVVESSGGMSLRDYFAIRVLQANLSDPGVAQLMESIGAAKVTLMLTRGAYQWADAMIKARAA